MKTPKVGERYWNLYNEVHEVLSISEDRSELTARNITTNEEVKFELLNYTHISWYYTNGYGISKISLGERYE